MRYNRNVLLATPALDGRVDVWYANSLVDSVRIAQENGIFLHPVYLSYEALIQRARNDLFKIAIEGNYDDMVMVDSDIEWDPQWILELLNRKEDVVGGTYRKKTDDFEAYVVKTKNTVANEFGLVKCEGLGAGFVKLSRKAFTALWLNSKEYSDGNKSSRMVCNVEIIDGSLYSEDIIMFKKLNELGFDCWLDPKMTCAHVGTKKFVGDVNNYLTKFNLNL